MGNVAIVTESASNLPPELVEEFNIHVLPMTMVWENQVYRDGIDITPQEFYTRLRLENFAPTTTAIAPGELLELFKKLTGDYDEIVAILLSGDLTSSVEIAQMVHRMEPSLPIHVVDSRTAAMAQGFIVLEAARAAAAGAAVEEIVAHAEEMRGRVHLIAALETLKYLRRGGRISAAAALMGSMLQLKPIIGIPPGQGRVIPLARPRTWGRAIEEMLDSIAEIVGSKPVHAAILQGDRDEAASRLAKDLRQRFDIRELYTSYLTPVMGVHAGPVLGVAYYVD
jgi:DegV family protein with EDD domain